MREFVFDIEYDVGADAFMDLHIETPELRSTALLVATADEELWRLDRLSGPDATVEEATALLTDTAYESLSISGRPCNGTTSTDILAGGGDECVVYTYFDCDGACDAVPFVSNRYFSGGLLFDVSRTDATEHWRILMSTDEKVGLLYDTLGGKLRDGLSFRFGHLDDVTDPPTNPMASLSMPSEQRRTLEVATEEGYYETPRETTLSEIADRLDCPRSTASYRLRRAEAHLARTYMSTT